LRFAAASVLNYAFGIALAWLLVPSAFGTVSALQNLLLLTAGALAAGLPWALAVKVAGSPRAPTVDAKEIRTGVLGNVGFGLLVATAFLLMQRAGLHLIPGAGVALTLTVACTMPLIGLSTVLAGALQGSRRFGGLGAMQAGEILVKCVVAVALVVIAHLGPEGVALGFLVGSLAASAIGLRALRGLMPGPGPLARLRAFRSAVPLWAGTASFTVLLTADILALGPLGRAHGATARVLAAYQVCAILARALFYVTDALIDAVFPFMASSRQSRATSHGWFVAAVRWVPLFVVPIQLALVLAPSIALGLFFPHSYGGSGPLLRLITIGTLGLLLTNMLVKGLYALHCAGQVGRRMPCAAFVELAVLATLVPSYGAIGAAIAYSLATWTGVILLTPVYLQKQQVGLPGWTLRGRYFLALTPSAALLAASNLVPDPVAWVLIVLALAMFAGMARLTRLITDHDIRRLRDALAAVRVRAPALRGADRRKPILSPVPGVPDRAPTDRTATAAPGGPRDPKPTDVGAENVPTALSVRRLVTPAGIHQVFIAPPAQSTGAPGPAGARYPPLQLVSARRRVTSRSELLLVVGCAAVAALATLTNVFSSPDNVYDEVVYTQAARNVAATWHLTWTNPPIFVHPPIFFLLQAAWLRVTGEVTGPVIDAVHAARVLTGAFEALNVGLLALLTYRLAERCRASRRRTLALCVALTAALDPVLLRYSRLAVIEPVALCLSLLALNLAWSLRRHRPLTYASAVGLCTGAALLTKELTIFLVVSPVLFACLERDRNLLGRTFGALGVGLASWLLFPLWALQLGLTGEFFQVQTRTLQRLVGLIQATGWNRPGVSFEAAVLRSASHYVSSYIVLALGLVAICWLWWGRNTTSANFVCAWLTTSFGLGAFLVTVGTLNEQFFVYVLPACIVASVFMVDALIVRAQILGRAVGWSARIARPAIIVLVAVFGTSLLTASVVSWVRQYSGNSQGVSRVARTIATTLPPCTIVNGSGDPEKYFYLGGRDVAYYTEGPAALSHGIHYFILAPNDVVAHYGNMTPGLASWIRGHGTAVASFPSKTYDAVQLWHVPANDYDPLADMEYVPGGIYINTVGSRCGGMTVTDRPRGNFFTSYMSHGGKALLGKPLTRVTGYNGQVFQIFEGVVLAAPSPAETAEPVALPILPELATRAPAIYRRLMLPSLSGPNLSASRSQRQAWLSDPAIAKVFLGTDASSPQGFDAGVQRFGLPLGPVTILPNGWVAQPFSDVVLERPRSGGPVRAAPIGRSILAAGLLKVPEDALSNEAPPPLPVSHVCGDQGCLTAYGPAQPSSVLPFIRGLLAGALLFAITIIAVLRLKRRSVALEAADENAA
jgi:O-antigen/teichoic acid export membrane protein